MLGGDRHQEGVGAEVRDEAQALVERQQLLVDVDLLLGLVRREVGLLGQEGLQQAPRDG
jgi:hypothetical protein